MRASLAQRFPPPPIPWTHEYNATHRGFLAAVFEEPRIRNSFSNGAALTRGYGVGLDERVVEYPWLAAYLPAGRTLDAGSVLNHEHILDLFLPQIDDLTIITQAPEPCSFPERGVSYTYGDLRALPFEDRAFDLVASISTLEHVGMDNRRFGSADPPDVDPQWEARRALMELERVLKPGGRLLFTVPFGQPEDHGWFRVFGPDELADLLHASQLSQQQADIFAYSAEGWQRSSRESAATAKYRDFLADPTPVEDHAAAARAVACVTLE